MRSSFAMLAFKSWLESRGRFLLCVAWTAGLCVIFIVFQGPIRAQIQTSTAETSTFAAFTYQRIYGGFVRGTFLFLALILGLSGLQRERHHATIGFTLSLPVSRIELFGARVLVGVAQIIALALLPAILVPTVSAMVGQSYPWQQSAQFALLWMVVGSAVFAFTTLVSAVVRNEYTALMVALAAFYLYPLMVVYVPLFRGRPVHIHYIMSGRGMSYFDARTDLLVGPFPWLILAGFAVAICLFIAVGMRATVIEEFS